MLKKAYDSSEKLSMKNRKYSRKVMDFLINEVCDDIGRFETIPRNQDVTMESIFKYDEDPSMKAEIIAKEDGVIAGLDESKQFYTSKGFDVKSYYNDGDEIKKGYKVLCIEGKAKSMLIYERTILNFMQRMSGIATATKKLKDKIKDYDTAIVATRKTQQRFFDKRAVTLGGGYTHRLGLYDAVMIKDTHLDHLRNEGIDDVIEEAIERASRYLEDENIKFVEIEVTNLEEAVRAASKFKDIYIRNANKFFEDPSLSAKEKYEYFPPNIGIIMLDNMKPSKIKKTISKLKKEDLYFYVLLEASGMINEKNIEKYAKTGVDVVSLGSITHSVKALDLSQKIIMEEK